LAGYRHAARSTLLGGLPQISAIALDSNAGFLESLQQSIRHQREATQAANLVVGLVLFQVILLGLTGTNNGAREIAGERMVFEKERMNLDPAVEVQEAGLGSQSSGLRGLSQQR
jgi:hypothetical protein